MGSLSSLPPPLTHRGWGCASGGGGCSQLRLFAAQSPRLCIANWLQRKLVCLMRFSYSYMFLNWLSRALVGVGGSDFVGRWSNKHKKKAQKNKRKTWQHKKNMVKYVHFYHCCILLCVCIKQTKVLTPRYPRSPLQDSRLFGPSPWKVLAATYEQMGSWATQPLAKIFWAGILLWKPGVDHSQWFMIIIIIIMIMMIMMIICMVKYAHFYHCVILLCLCIWAKTEKWKEVIKVQKEKEQKKRKS